MKDVPGWKVCDSPQLGGPCRGLPFGAPRALESSEHLKNPPGTGSLGGRGREGGSCAGGLELIATPGVWSWGGGWGDAAHREAAVAVSPLPVLSPHAGWRVLVPHRPLGAPDAGGALLPAPQQRAGQRAVRAAVLRLSPPPAPLPPRCPLVSPRHRGSCWGHWFQRLVIKPPVSAVPDAVVVVPGSVSHHLPPWDTGLCRGRGGGPGSGWEHGRGVCERWPVVAELSRAVLPLPQHPRGSRTCAPHPPVPAAEILSLGVTVGCDRGWGGHTELAGCRRGGER